MKAMFPEIVNKIRPREDTIHNIDLIKEIPRAKDTVEICEFFKIAFLLSDFDEIFKKHFFHQYVMIRFKSMLIA